MEGEREKERVRERERRESKFVREGERVKESLLSADRGYLNLSPANLHAHLSTVTWRDRNVPNFFRFVYLY
jgi:hypothetical protein